MDWFSVALLTWVGGLKAFVKMYPKHFEMGTVKFKQENITFTKLVFLDPAASY